jgi:hypothetical protein
MDFCCSSDQLFKSIIGQSILGLPKRISVGELTVRIYVSEREGQEQEDLYLWQQRVNPKNLTTGEG